MGENFSLSGKNALVTGGSSGIGLAIAQAFVAAGARVVVSGRSAKALDEAIKVLGPNCISVKADVKSVTEIDLMFNTISQKVGALDVVVANAGTASPVLMDSTTEALFIHIPQIVESLMPTKRLTISIATSATSSPLLPY